jgi:hypothetical protein
VRNSKNLQLGMLLCMALAPAVSMAGPILFAKTTDISRGFAVYMRYKGSKIPEEKWEKLEVAVYQQTLGYILGVADAGSGTEFCFPQEIVAGDLIDAVMKAAQATEMKLPAKTTVEAALRTRFPCSPEVPAADRRG